MKNGASSLTSGFENQLPASTQIEPIELILDIFCMFYSSNMMATNATDATDDINSDHDIDTEHEGSLSEVMCPNGKHKWKHDQCMVCGICGECSGKHQS